LKYDDHFLEVMVYPSKRQSALCIGRKSATCGHGWSWNLTERQLIVFDNLKGGSSHDQQAHPTLTDNAILQGQWQGTSNCHVQKNVAQVGW